MPDQIVWIAQNNTTLLCSSVNIAHCEVSYCVFCKAMERCDRHGVICSACHEDGCKNTVIMVIVIGNDGIPRRLRIGKSISTLKNLLDM